MSTFQNDLRFLTCPSVIYPFSSFPSVTTCPDDTSSWNGHFIVSIRHLSWLFGLHFRPHLAFSSDCLLSFTGREVYLLMFCFRFGVGRSYRRFIFVVGLKLTPSRGFSCCSLLSSSPIGRGIIVPNRFCWICLRISLLTRIYLKYRHSHLLNVLLCSISRLFLSEERSFTAQHLQLFSSLTPQLPIISVWNVKSHRLDGMFQDYCSLSVLKWLYFEPESQLGIVIPTAFSNGSYYRFFICTLPYLYRTQLLVRN